MLPDQITAEQFQPVPAGGARSWPRRQIALLQRLPLAFLPLLLRELIVYDWKFPAERADLDRQFRISAGCPPGRSRRPCRPSRNSS